MKVRPHEEFVKARIERIVKTNQERYHHAKILEESRKKGKLTHSNDKKSSSPSTTKHKSGGKM